MSQIAPRLITSALVMLVAAYTINELDPVVSERLNWTNMDLSRCPTCCEIHCSHGPNWINYAKANMLDIGTIDVDQMFLI